MAADGLWKDCMRVLNKVFKICNMHVERCLARGRLCVQQSDTVPVIEKVRAASMLNEVLTAHFGQGGRDPRFTTSKSLLEKGVPLRRGKVKRKIIKRSSGYSRFFGKMIAANKNEEKTKRKHRKIFSAEVSTLWHQLSDVDRAAYSAEADVAKQRAVTSSSMPDQPAASDPIAVNGGFWGASSMEQPFTSSAFVDTIQRDLGVLPAASTYMQHYRGSMASTAFVEDDHMIKQGTKFKHKPPCWKRHPDLCETRDSEIYKEVIQHASMIGRFPLVFGFFRAPSCMFRMLAPWTQCSLRRPKFSSVWFLFQGIWAARSGHSRGKVHRGACVFL